MLTYILLALLVLSTQQEWKNQTVLCLFNLEPNLLLLVYLEPGLQLFIVLPEEKLPRESVGELCLDTHPLFVFPPLACFCLADISVTSRKRESNLSLLINQFSPLSVGGTTPALNEHPRGTCYFCDPAWLNSSTCSLPLMSFIDGLKTHRYNRLLDMGHSLQVPLP